MIRLLKQVKARVRYYAKMLFRQLRGGEVIPSAFL